MATPSVQTLLKVDQLPDHGNVDRSGLNAPEAVRARRCWRGRRVESAEPRQALWGAVRAQ